MTVHDLKDLAMIYHDADDYKVTVWDPVNQKNYELSFTGSSNSEKTVNFNITECAATKEERAWIDNLNERIALTRYKDIIEKRLEELKNEAERR